MDNQIEVVRNIRAFNRFYTDIIGLLDQHLLDSPYSLAEARIIYEMYHAKTITASRIMELMHIDKSYLSRLLRKLEKDGVIARKKSMEDGRAVIMTLTDKGRKEFNQINQASDNQISKLIDPLSSSQKQNLAVGMSSVMDTIKLTRETVSLDDVVIRTNLLPGDLGYVAWLHGKIYAEECGYGPNFEGYVLESLGELAHKYDPAKDRVWICEHKSSMVGFLAAVHRGDCMQLRYFILLPEYRGIGLGKKLMDMFMDYLKAQKFNKAYLWTSNEQLTAIALYKKHGFVLAEEKSSVGFDKALIEQRYDLDLNKQK